MGSQFSQNNPQRCQHYAGFMSHLNRVGFDVLYWSLFMIVILILFMASWKYNKIMSYKDGDEDLFRRKLSRGIWQSTALFLLAAVCIVLEVYSLLALQFCDGEDLVSLYWSTWTMLQVGSEIAVLGVVLALVHHLYDIKNPQWALALGTPVLVAAGFAYAIKELSRRQFRNYQERRRSRANSTSELPIHEKPTVSSSAATIIEWENDRPATAIYLEIDVGETDRVVRGWPAFVRMSGPGTALVKAVMQRQVPQSTTAAGSIFDTEYDPCSRQITFDDEMISPRAQAGPSMPSATYNSASREMDNV